MCVQNNILGDCITITRKSLCVLANVFWEKTSEYRDMRKFKYKEGVYKIKHARVCMCVLFQYTHTSQRTPGVYCRRVSLNVDQQL